MYLILHYLKRYKTYVFFNILAILGFAAAELGIPTIVSRMIDNGIVLNDRAYIYKMGAAILAVAIAGGIGNVLLEMCIRDRVIIDDMYFILVRQILRLLHILSHRTADQSVRDHGLAILSRDKIHKILCVRHMAAALDNAHHIRGGNDALLHINQPDRFPLGLSLIHI